VIVVRLIKRYGSRKLYDTEESRYVSLEEIGEWIRRGQQIRVIDNKTSDDVTAPTLAQVILEDSRRGAPHPSIEILHELIRRGGALVSTGVEQLQHGVDRILRAGVDRVGPLREAREETQVLRRRLEELEATLSRLETASSVDTDEPKDTEAPRSTTAPASTGSK
jgi:polyhydroxyalkanoate synthesis repressor PhaR